MKCRACKNEIDDESIYCKWCGEKQVRTRRKKGDIKVPELVQLPSGAWRIQLRKENMSVTEATEALCVAKAKAIRAGFVEQSRRYKPLTVGEAMDSYIADNRNVLSPSTIRGYCAIRENHFGSVMDCDVHSDVDYQKAINEAALKYSPKTIKNDWGLITAALRYAKVEPPDVNLPQKIVKELPWLSYTQIQQFLELIKGEPYELSALLALHSLRRSELFAVERGCYRQPYFRPRQQGVRFRQQSSLQGHKQDCRVNAHCAYRDSASQGNTAGRVRAACAVQHEHADDANQQAVRAAGLPEVGLHGLRRSFASLAHHLGWDVRTTMRFGGWSDYKTVNDFYIKLDETDLFRDATKMMEFYAGTGS